MILRIPEDMVKVSTQMRYLSESTHVMVNTDHFKVKCSHVITFAGYTLERWHRIIWLTAGFYSVGKSLKHSALTDVINTNAKR